MKKVFFKLGIAFVMAATFFACSGKVKPRDIFTVSLLDGDNSVQINWYRGDKWTAIEIPKVIRDLPVARIGDSAFQGEYLNGVTIPDSVTDIGIWAFENNLLTSVIIPDSVACIGKFAFSNNKISSITIGPDVALGEQGSQKYIASFDNKFDAFYKSNESRAGTYTFDNGSWSAEFR